MADTDEIYTNLERAVGTTSYKINTFPVNVNGESELALNIERWNTAGVPHLGAIEHVQLILDDKGMEFLTEHFGIKE